MRQPGSLAHHGTCASGREPDPIHQTGQRQVSRRLAAASSSIAERHDAQASRTPQSGQRHRSARCQAENPDALQARSDVRRPWKVTLLKRCYRRLPFFVRMTSARYCFFLEERFGGRPVTEPTRSPTRSFMLACAGRSLRRNRSRTMSDFETRRARDSFSISRTRLSGNRIVKVFTIQNRKTTAPDMQEEGNVFCNREGADPSSP